MFEKISELTINIIYFNELMTYIFKVSSEFFCLIRLEVGGERWLNE